MACLPDSWSFKLPGLRRDNKTKLRQCQKLYLNLPILNKNEKKTVGFLEQASGF